MSSSSLRSIERVCIHIVWQDEIKMRRCLSTPGIAEYILPIPQTITITPESPYSHHHSVHLRYTCVSICLAPASLCRADWLLWWDMHFPASAECESYRKDICSEMIGTPAMVHCFRGALDTVDILGAAGGKALSTWPLVISTDGCDTAPEYCSDRFEWGQYMSWFWGESGGATCTLVLVYVSIRLRDSQLV